MSDEQNDNKHPTRIMDSVVQKLIEIFGVDQLLSYDGEVMERVSPFFVTGGFYHDTRTRDRIRVQCLDKSQYFLATTTEHPIDVKQYIQFHQVLSQALACFESLPDHILVKVDIQKAYEVFEYDQIRDPFYRAVFQNRIVEIQGQLFKFRRGLFVGGILDWSIFRQFMQGICVEIEHEIHPIHLHCFADDMFILVPQTTDSNAIIEACSFILKNHRMKANPDKVKVFNLDEFRVYVTQKGGRRAVYGHPQPQTNEINIEE